MTDPYWVEARTALKTGRVMAYAVWTDNDGERREEVHRFPIVRGNWQVALHLANTLRDDLNKEG